MTFALASFASAPRFLVSLSFPVFAALAGCASAGPWGFSRDYTPLDAEEAAAEGSREYDPVMVGRRFHEWVGQSVSVFGVVEGREDAPDGRTDLALSIRVLQDRNLCETAAQDSCRVTVSEHEFAVLHAFVTLRPEAQSGETRLIRGSLVRVIGTVSKEPHPKTGGTVLEGKYYRHWPHKYFVTTKARDYMLR